MMNDSNVQPGVDQLTRGDLIRSLRSHLCPSCSGDKAMGKSFCPRCYHALPPGERSALYDHVGQGYEAAIANALRTLDVTWFRLPPASGPTVTKAAAAVELVDKQKPATGLFDHLGGGDKFSMGNR